MFTGLVQSIGTVKMRGNGTLAVLPESRLQDLVRGESIAVNGCCLSLERAAADGTLFFHTMEESLKRTNLGAVKLNGKVNLERALRLGDRLGGHLVQGHVDCAAAVMDSRRLPDGDYFFRVALAKEYAPLVVEKGSIAIDGVSLTVAEVGADSFAVRLIPLTLADTALVNRAPGELVNLEFDVIGRYFLRKMELERASKSSGITYETLNEAGFF